MRKTDSMDAISFNKLLYVICAVIVVVTIAVSAYFVLSLDAKSKEMSMNKYISSTNNKKIEALATLEAKYHSMNDIEQRLGEYLPQGKETSELIRGLESLAVEQGIGFKAYTVDDNKTTNATVANGDIQVKKIDNYYVLPIKIELDGSFVKINEMMKSIEGYNRLIEVKQVDYEKSMDTRSDDVTASLKLNVYLKQ